MEQNSPTGATPDEPQSDPPRNPTPPFLGSILPTVLLLLVTTKVTAGLMAASSLPLPEPQPRPIGLVPLIALTRRVRTAAADGPGA